MVSFGSFFLSYVKYRSGILMPEIATHLNEFELSDRPLSISANFDFSVSNRSSLPVFIVKCEIVTDGLPAGGGGYGEHFEPCNIERISAVGGLELPPAQTEFFNAQHELDLDDHSPVLALELMGIDLEEIRPTLSKENCRAKLFAWRTGSAMSQNCQTQRLRADQMSGARDSFEESEAKMLEAQTTVLELQEQLGVLDPVAESGSVMSQVTAFQTQLQEKRLELAQLNSNLRPNLARVAGVEGDIQRLQAVVDELRSDMTDGTTGVASLARVSAQLRIAETDLQTRTALMQQALQQLETARIEANRQVRYLSLGVSPIPPDEPTYPRSFENTLLAFLIFSGIYLMLSLTASILREQVSS